MIPYTELLGELELLQVIDYYDQPLLFIEQNHDQKTYLCMVVKDDRISVTWYVQQVSDIRLSQVLRGGIDLRSAFIKNEYDQTYVIEYLKMEKRVSATNVLQSEEIDGDLLPDEGDYLSIGKVALEPLKENITIKSKRLWRDILRLRVKETDQEKHEISAGVLGNTLSTLQELLYAIAQSILALPTKKGPISKDITRFADLNFSDAGCGSIEVELISAEGEDIFGTSKSSMILQAFLNLIDVSQDVDKLIEELKKLNIRVAGKYLSFLESLDGKIEESHFKFASPTLPVESSSYLSSNVVVSAKAVIIKFEFTKPEIIIADGILIGANLEKMSFDIHEPLENNSLNEYTGKFDENLKPSLQGIALGERYRVSIEKNTKIKSATGEVEVIYSLLSIKPLSK